MDVTRVAGEVGAPFGHEAHRLALQVGDLLDAVLVDHMPVGHLQRLGIDEVQLLLAGAPLAFALLHRDAGGFHAVADRAHQRLALGGLQDVVVLDVPAGRLEIAVVLLARRRVAVIEGVELELRGHLGGVAERLHALELPLEDRARAVWQRLAIMVGDVAEDQGGAGQPGDPAQGAEVRPDDEVAVALVPGRGLEARDRLHLHVDREQIVAGVPFLVHRIQEVASGATLADQPPLHVGERGHDGVDLAAGHQFLELPLVQPA